MKDLKEYCISRINLLENELINDGQMPDDIIWAIESRIIEVKIILIEFCDMSEEEVDKL